MHRHVEDAVLQEFRAGHGEAAAAVIAVQMRLRIQRQVLLAEQADGLLQEQAAEASAAGFR